MREIALTAFALVACTPSASRTQAQLPPTEPGTTVQPPPAPTADAPAPAERVSVESASEILDKACHVLSEGDDELEILCTDTSKPFDLAPLTRVDGLDSLTLDHVALEDLSSLPRLEIHTLRVRVEGPLDLRGIEKLPNLTRLEVESTNGLRFAALERAPKLQELDLEVKAADDLTPLAKIQSLVKLTIVCRDAALPSMKGLTQLRSLTVLGAKLTDVTALAAVNSLEKLEIQAVALSDVSALAGLSTLDDLAILSKALTNVSALGSLTRLTSLRLWTGAIKDTKPIHRLKALRQLSLNADSAKHFDRKAFEKAVPKCEVRL